MSNWPVIPNGVVVGLGNVVALGNTPNSGNPPAAPPGQLDFSKPRNSGLLILGVP